MTHLRSCESVRSGWSYCTADRLVNAPKGSQEVVRGSNGEVLDPLARSVYFLCKPPTIET